MALNRFSAIRLAAGLALGWATSSAVLTWGFVLLKASWPEYALANPDKSYTLPMLFVRLLIFSSMIVATSGVATLVSGNKHTPWIVGILIFAISIPPHIYPGYVWNDYPAWYHIAYLLSIVPIAVAGGRTALHVSLAGSYGISAAQHDDEDRRGIAG